MYFGQSFLNFVFIISTIISPTAAGRPRTDRVGQVEPPRPTVTFHSKSFTPLDTSKVVFRKVGAVAHTVTDITMRLDIPVYAVLNYIHNQTQYLTDLMGDVKVKRTLTRKSLTYTYEDQLRYSLSMIQRDVGSMVISFASNFIFFYCKLIYTVFNFLLLLLSFNFNFCFLDSDFRNGRRSNSFVDCYIAF